MDRSAVVKSIAGAAIGAPVAYFLKKSFEAWGILDPLAETFGNWLKVHVSPAEAGWTLALAITLGLYGLLLWKVWRPRHIHHLPIGAATAPQASVEAKPTTGTHRYSDFALQGYGEDIALPPSVTPAVIMGECRGKTSLQCEGATAVYMGQRLAVSGTLYAATRFLGSATTVSIALDSVEHGSAFMTFEADRERLAVLKPGDRLSATGRIVAADSSEIRLADCRLA